MSLYVPDTGSRLTGSLSLTTSIVDMTAMTWGYLPTSTGRRGFFDIVMPAGGMICLTTTDGVTSDFGVMTSPRTDHLGPALPVADWFHIAMTWACNNQTNSRVIRGYINGKLAVITTDVTASASVSGIYAGTVFNGSSSYYPLKGYMQDFRFWSRALSDLEVRAEMWNGAPNRKGLRIWSPFEEELVTDRSGNGNTWTAVGNVALVGGPTPRHRSCRVGPF